MAVDEFYEGMHYHYTTITLFANRNDYELKEYGNNRIGKNFLVLSLRHKSKEKVISFVLDGVMEGYIYRCIYVDR